MNKKFGLVWHLLSRYKYLIVLTVGVLFMGFLDDNSFLQLVKYNLQISELEEQIANYNERNEAAMKELEDLRRDPKAIERIAREHYFMKADDEDIFVLSDDIQPDDETENEELNLGNDAVK